jgi:hypothetical protein
LKVALDVGTGEAVGYNENGLLKGGLSLPLPNKSTNVQ